MKADVLLRTPRGQVPGEISSEVDSLPGEPCFVPWRTISGFRQDIPLPVAELPSGSEVGVLDPRQEGRVLAAVAEHGIQVSVVPRERRSTQRRSVSVTVDDPDYRKIGRLAARDGVPVAAWIRSALKRELSRRRV